MRPYARRGSPSFPARGGTAAPTTSATTSERRDSRTPTSARPRRTLINTRGASCTEVGPTRDEVGPRSLHEGSRRRAQRATATTTDRRNSRTPTSAIYERRRPGPGPRAASCIATGPKPSAIGPHSLHEGSRRRTPRASAAAADGRRRRSTSDADRDPDREQPRALQNDDVESRIASGLLRTAIGPTGRRVGPRSLHEGPGSTVRRKSVTRRGRGSEAERAVAGGSDGRDHRGPEKRNAPPTRCGWRGVSRSGPVRRRPFPSGS